jgi:transposase InsO family protein
MSKKGEEVIRRRKEFVQLATQKGSNIRLLCERYGFSPRTGYKWIRRYQESGEAGLVDQSRKPKHSPRQTDPKMEELVLQKRKETGWGGRKIARVLQNEGYANVPHANTMTDILRRHGQISETEQKKHHAWQRFERAAPNALWQMDFKGHFPMVQGRCHPLTVLDDHSRFCVGLEACADETIATTQARLTRIFRRYGLPAALLCDNGGPWGKGYPRLELTHLTVWLMRLGIQILHGRPAHPQTQGKDERFHRTLNIEVIQRTKFAHLRECQRHFDRFRDRYNLVRPHEALAMDTPSQHYQPSPIPFPRILPVVEYDAGQIVRKVQYGGVIYFKNREFRVGKALHGQSVRLLPTDQDGAFDVFFSNTRVDQISLRPPKP